MVSLAQPAADLLGCCSSTRGTCSSVFVLLRATRQSIQGVGVLQNHSTFSPSAGRTASERLARPLPSCSGQAPLSQKQVMRRQNAPELPRRRTLSIFSALPLPLTLSLGQASWQFSYLSALECITLMFLPFSSTFSSVIVFVIGDCRAVNGGGDTADAIDAPALVISF
jgi:hypothetical protein